MKALTTQEKRVLELVSQGHSSIEIAQALGVSEHTVESHRKNLLNKLEARNTANLIRKAFHSRVLNFDSGEKANPIPYGTV
jgi:DNA-binding CsgD family transcriptional regulator